MLLLAQFKNIGVILDYFYILLVVHQQGLLTLSSKYIQFPAFFTMSVSVPQVQAAVICPELLQQFLVFLLFPLCLLCSQQSKSYAFQIGFSSHSGNTPSPPDQSIKPDFSPLDNFELISYSLPPGLRQTAFSPNQNKSGLFSKKVKWTQGASKDFLCYRIERTRTQSYYLALRVGIFSIQKYSQDSSQA